MLTGSTLQKLLTYDAESGVFTRLSGRGAGKEAGSEHSFGYREISVGGKRHLCHRLAWLWMTGKWPENEIDHIDGDKSNNAISNLRAATSSQNNRNVGGHSDSLSGLKGVSWHSSSRKWRSRIRAEGREVNLGNFETPEEAHAAYARAAIQFHGEFARAA